jgi:hypothetical protein
VTFARSIWYRKSGVVSTTIRVVEDSTKMLDRRRLSFLSAEWQTGQGQAIIGTPALVPEPRKVIFIEGNCTDKNR